MSFKQSTSLENSGQSIGCDPKSAKRNSGLFAFLKWFKPSASRESITAEPQISQSSSCDSLNSTHSVGTVASFSFVPPSDYKKCVSEKCIALGPETDTYKARLKQRDKRKENDKNLTLRKKYNLFFNRDTLLKPKTLEIDEENSKSLPLMTRGGMESVEVHRRTISESSNIRRVGSHSHVKGKRKAPQPPSLKVPQEGMSTASLRRTKRLAPTPPAVSAEKVIKSIDIVDETNPVAYEDLGIICNDSLKLDNGILKSVKDLSPNSKYTEIEQNKNETSTFLKPPSKSTIVEAPVSPRPWYKRNTSRESVTRKDKNENKYEPIERLPEVPFSRNSSLDLTLDEIQDERRRDEKRKSGMSFLTNISELDREACEIMKNKEQVQTSSTQMGKIPEFMRPRDIKMNMDSWVSPKRRSARDLIAKFNAITNVTKATVFGASQRETQLIGKQRSLDETKRQEQVLESHQKTIEEIDKKKIPLAKSESTNTVTPKPETPKQDRKSWVCPKCNIGNDYWRIICHVCSSIKPYFDDLSVSFKDDHKIQTKRSSPLITRKDKYIPQKMEIERSKTQIEFSALASYNGKVKADQLLSKDGKSQKEMDHKKEQREKLRKMLIDMKNSLPKRKTNAFLKQNNKKSILEDNIELTKELVENEDIDDTSNGKTNAAKYTEKESHKTQEEKVAEILIGTTQTIYENIKVKKTDNPKLMKVSSSAQTSGVVKQLVPTSTIANLIKNQNKHNNYELMRPKDFENIYSDSNSKSAATVYANLSRNHELSLFFNMPKNLKKETSNTDTLRINVLLKKLENSISEGELKDAAIFAEELAQLRVNCSVIRQKPKVSPEVEKRRIHLEMYVEDKISHRGPFPIEVNADQTVAQLKAQIEKEFEIPAAYQKWILGKELVTDEKSTLKDHNITSEGCPVFLYLVAPELECDNIQKKAVTKEEPKQSTSGTGIELPKTETRESGTDMKNEIDNVKNNVRDLQNILKENRNKTKNSESSSIDHAPKIVNVIRKTTETSSKEEVTVIPIVVESSESKEISNLTKTEKVLTTTEINIKIEHNQPKLLKNPSLEVKPKIQYVFPTIQNSYQHSSIENKPSTEPRKALEITPVAESSKVSKRRLQEIAPITGSSCSKDPPKAEDEDDLEYYEAKTLKPSKEWECHLCTLLNPISSNVCAVCATVRIKKLERPPNTNEKVKRKAPQPERGEQSSPKRDQTYLQLVNLDNADLVENNASFECMICFLEIPPNEGVTLRECLHQFCKACLAHTIEFADEAEIKCPYRDDVYSCTIALQDREIKALVVPNIYEQHLAKSIAQAENKIDKSFHCKTPDCKGWCIFEDNVNEFRCPVCHKLNCLTCQAVHAGLNCKQYQERMKAESEIDDEAKRTKDMLEEMVNKGEAIECPTCRVILMKKWGCDWLRCSMCKTEICWVTRGPRWGPAGKGDTTGGCQCGVNGVKCHPKCNYCH